MPSRPAAAVLATLLLAASARAELIDRVLAVVDETPVLLSETVALQRLKQLDRPAALQALIDEILMLGEASRVREAAATRDEEARAYESLLAKSGPGTAGLDEDALRRIARRETVILKYIELRFRPQLRVDEAELKDAYQQEYGGKSGAPTFEAVSKELLARLSARALDRRIEAWVQELRASAKIRLVPEPAQP